MDNHRSLTRDNQDTSFTDVHNSIEQYQLEDLDASYSEIPNRNEDAAYIDTSKQVPPIKLGRISNNLFQNNIIDQEGFTSAREKEIDRLD